MRLSTIAAVASSVVLLGALPAQAQDIVIGSSGSHISGTAEHRYGKLTGPAITSAAFVNIETTVAWSQVANGSKDSDLRRWANALKGKNVMVSWSHEPMAKQNIHFGNAQSFIASFRHVVSVFNSVGSTSVKWVWNVTSYSFRISSSRSDYGAKWYPGDSYVDYVAGESYNRCGDKVHSFATQLKEILAFAGKHGKKLVAAEVGSRPDSTRTAWLNAMHSYMDSNKSKFAGAFYANTTYSGCVYKLKTASELSAIRSMANDAGFTG